MSVNNQSSLLIECKNGCGETVPIDDAATHIETHHPEKQVPSWRETTTIHIACQNCGVQQDRDGRWGRLLDCWITDRCPVCGEYPTEDCDKFSEVVDRTRRYLNTEGGQDA